MIGTEGGQRGRGMAKERGGTIGYFMVQGWVRWRVCREKRETAGYYIADLVTGEDGNIVAQARLFLEQTDFDRTNLPILIPNCKLYSDENFKTNFIFNIY